MWSRTRGCLAAGLCAAAGSFLLVAGPAHAGDAVFQAQTAATAVHVTLTQQPASSIITASLVDDATAYAASAFDSSGGSEAQSAAVYPGTLVVQGPALFCSEVFTCPFTVPAYPLLADASYPRHDHAEASSDQPTVGGGPLVVSPARSTATADAQSNIASTSTGRTSILSGTPVAITFGASTAMTHVAATASALVTHVESTVTDVDIGGLVHVGAVRAVDDITVPATGKPKDAAHITVTGVTVAGVPATIDDHGIEVAGRKGPSLTQQVAQQGIDIRTVGAQHDDTGSLARSQATGLAVTFSVPVSGVPYVPNPLPAPFDQVPGVNANGTYLGYVTFGAVGAVAGANATPSFALGGSFPLSSPAPRAEAPDAALADNPLLGAPAAAPVQAPRSGPQIGLLRGILDGVTVDLADLYAVLALGTALMFVGWRATTALRRTRGAVGRGG